MQRLHRGTRSVLDSAPTSLLVRPQALPGESWGGYLMRLVEANRLGRLRDLTRLVGYSEQRVLVIDPAAALRALSIEWTGPRPRGWRALDPHRRRANPTGAGRSFRFRVCSLCLSEDATPYIRADWEMPMSIECERHGTLLLDKCGSCHADFDFRRTSASRCVCGARLAAMRTRPSPSWANDLSRVFAEARTGGPTETFGRATPVSQQAARICQWLVAKVDPRTNRRPRRLRQSTGFLTQDCALRVGELLFDWPRNAADALECEMDSSKAYAFKYLSFRLRLGTFRELRTIIKELRLRLRPTKRPRRISSDTSLGATKKNSYGIRDLMRLTNHSYDALVASINAGNLPGVTYKVDQARGLLQFDIPTNVYASLQKAIWATNDIEATAKQLGCSVKAVRGLVASRCLESYSFVVSAYCCRINAAEAATLATQLFARARYDTKIASMDRVYFSGWASRDCRARTSWRWRRILEAIKHRELQLYAAIPSPIALDELFVVASELKKVLAPPHHQELRSSLTNKNCRSSAKTPVSGTRP